MRRGPGDAGFALLTSLWLVALAALIATAFLLPARVDRMQVLNRREAAYASLAAGAGLAHAVARLNHAVVSHPGDDQEDQSLNDVAELSSDLDSVLLADGIWYSVWMADAGSRLHLNEATENELRKLIVALGIDYQRADVIAQSILDWRDEDGLHRGRGAEWNDYYRHQAPAVRPRNGPLASVRELRFVRGMNDELLSLISDFVTVHGDGRVNLNTAPEPVLAAVPGMSRELAQYILARRRQGSFISNLYELEAALTSPARKALLADFADFAARVVLEPRRILVYSMGRTRFSAGPSRRGAEMSRIGNSFVMVDRWVP